jgi:CheY-like chemotaxis protein
MLRRLLGDRIELVVSLAADAGLVQADPGQIEQVILSLALNAREAMPDGGILYVQTARAEFDEAAARNEGLRRPGRYVELQVLDTGIGMDPATQARIFEPVFTAKPEGGGTGLGLSAAYGIVARSGGHISVRSLLREGTAFRVYLPWRPAEGVLSTDSDDPVRPQGGTETILVAEDDAPVRRLACSFLADAGYHCLEARDGAEALRRLAKEARVDLVLTDLAMPRVGGRELVERLQDQRNHPRVLCMSGYATEDLPGAPFLLKPFTRHEVLAKVREVLDASQGQGQRWRRWVRRLLLEKLVHRIQWRLGPVRGEIDGQHAHDQDAKEAAG